VNVVDFHARLTPGDGEPGRLLAAMDAAGIDRAAVCAGGLLALDRLATQINDGGRAEVAADNEGVRQACERTGGRLLPFYFADPVRDVAAYRKNAVDFRGLEISPAVHGGRLDDPEVDELVGIAEAAGHPVYVVTVAHPGGRPADLVELAARFPRVTFVWGHCGHIGFDIAGLHTIAASMNVLAELSGCLTITARLAVTRLGARRVLFGTEYPLQQPEVELCKVAALGLDPLNNTVMGDWAGYPELERLQNARLAGTLKAAARSPFYAKRGLPADRAELAAYPLTTKQDLRDAYPFGLLAVDRAELATYHESSGSSGTPTSSYYTPADWQDLVDRYARKHVGIRADDTFLVRTPYALMITGHLAHAAARSRGATVVPADNRSLAMPYAKVVRVLHDLGVTLTWSLATDTLLWAAAARLAGREPGRDFPALRALFVGGDPLGPAKKARIAQIWNAPVVEEYGATETGSLAGECPSGHLHFWSDRAIPEVYRPQDGTVVAEGSGQLVVTPLYREAMPLLRYNIEDAVEVSYPDCLCGWVLPVVRVLGRSAWTVHTTAAELTQGDIEDLVFGLPAEYGVMFWRARASESSLLVQIEGPEAAAHDLREAIGKVYRLEAVVEALPPGALVPQRSLTAEPEVVKPRGLFRAGEDWTKAWEYY
jgi:phenylacetate-CoA ligase